MGVYAFLLDLWDEASMVGKMVALPVCMYQPAAVQLMYSFESKFSFYFFFFFFLISSLYCYCYDADFFKMILLPKLSHTNISESQFPKHSPGADLRQGCPLLFFAQTGYLTVCGHLGTAAFLLQSVPSPYWKLLNLPLLQYRVGMEKSCSEICK